MKKKYRKQLLGHAVPYVILFLIALCFLLPLLWVIIASVDPNAMQTIKRPAEITLDNYVSVISDKGNQRAFIVGLLMSFSQALAVVLLAGLAAYPLSRYHMRFKKPFMYTILFMTSLPITAVMVPVYQLFISLKLYDRNYGVVLFLIASALPYAIWMMKNFMDSVPVELEEAAWVDGASVFTTVRKIIAPLMLPGICTVGIFTFSGSWGGFFVPYILLYTPEKFPASIKLYQYFGHNMEWFNMVNWQHSHSFIPAHQLYYTFSHSK